MIGLVLVSHSARLAEGVAELAAQMGANGRRYAVQHFSLSRGVARLESLLSLVASGAGRKI